MQNDPENHSYRDSTWTEDEILYQNITAPQPKQPATPTQRIQLVQIQPKQQTTVQIPRYRGRKDVLPKKDNIDEQEILQEKLAALQKEKEQYDSFTSAKDVQYRTEQGQTKRVKQRQKKSERKTKKPQASQQPKQQGNNDHNNMNADISDIQGTVGQPTGLQPSSCVQSQNLCAGLRQKETGSISACNRERTDPQINEGQEDNAEEEEDEQTDEAALIQNKDYRVNIILYLQDYAIQGKQPQNNQGLNTLSQMEKDDSDPTPAGIQKKPKKGRGSKKTKTKGLCASNESCKGYNVKTQTKTASKVPKPKATRIKGWKKAELVRYEPKNSNDEDEWEQSPCSGRDTPTKGDQH
ncbi:MAG: hypothetical protein EZS28_005398 [Streblomastix strix]|uniref:Uncharacterized protein n=1 Tax=Streblomastix strix TaxID=222440 RepID=A0A5J4WXH9_9EUKA|nr:MAG: hypothetical protein EZS28_005398 [Streblomastix strix]